MLPAMVDELDRYRAEMLRQGVPSAVVAEWIGAALPCATLTMDGDGPVVGRYGGPLLLPADARSPEFPFLASLDCAALPEEVTGLPLPSDGRLLLFALPDMDAGGEVTYVPEGAAVEERAGIPDFYDEYDEDHGDGDGDDEDDEDSEYLELAKALPEGELRLTPGVSLPRHTSKAKATSHGWRGEPLPWARYRKEIESTLRDEHFVFPRGGRLQIGGHAVEEAMDVNPVESAALQSDEIGELEDWVLLADWAPGIEGREGFFLHWAIRRQELAARRFDRTSESMFWNP